MVPDYEFKLGQDVAIKASGEIGEITSRSESLENEYQYLLFYKDATGKAVENWWGESQLESIIEAGNLEATDSEIAEDPRR